MFIYSYLFFSIRIYVCLFLPMLIYAYLFLCIYSYLFIYLSVYLSIYLSNLPIDLSLSIIHDISLKNIFHYLSISIIIYHYLSLSIIINHYLSLSIITYHYLSLSLIIYHDLSLLITYLSFPIIIYYLSIYLSISLSVYRSIDLSIYRSIYLSLSISLSINLSLYPSIDLSKGLSLGPHIIIHTLYLSAFPLSVCLSVLSMFSTLHPSVNLIYFSTLDLSINHYKPIDVSKLIPLSIQTSRLGAIRFQDDLKAACSFWV